MRGLRLKINHLLLLLLFLLAFPTIYIFRWGVMPMDINKSPGDFPQVKSHSGGQVHLQKGKHKHTQPKVQETPKRRQEVAPVVDNNLESAAKVTVDDSSDDEKMSIATISKIKPKPPPKGEVKTLEDLRAEKKKQRARKYDSEDEREELKTVEKKGKKGDGKSSKKDAPDEDTVDWRIINRKRVQDRLEKEKKRKQQVDHPASPKGKFYRDTCKYSDDANEQCFCLPNFLKWSNKMVNILWKGSQEMKKRNVVITGLIQNVGLTLENDVAFLHELGSRFADYRILLVENDSRDNTTEVMNNICAGEKFICLYGTMHVRSANKWGLLNPKRFQILSMLRNKALNYLHDARIFDPSFAIFDLLLIIDLDLSDHNEGKAPMIELDTLATAFGQAPNGFDLVCANGVIDDYIYRDTLPLVSFEPEFRGVTRGARWETRLHLLRDGVSLIQAKSCFGGFGIYNLTSLMASRCRYSTRKGICEHMILNGCMSQMGHDRIFLGPSMIAYYIGYPSECRTFAISDLDAPGGYSGFDPSLDEAPVNNKKKAPSGDKKPA